MTPSGRTIVCADLSQFTSTLSFMESTQELTAGHLTGPWNFSVSYSSFPKQQGISLSQINPLGNQTCFVFPAWDWEWLDGPAFPWKQGLGAWTHAMPRQRTAGVTSLGFCISQRQPSLQPSTWILQEQWCLYMILLGWMLPECRHLCSRDSTLEHVNSAEPDPCILCADVNRDGLFFSLNFPV